MAADTGDDGALRQGFIGWQCRLRQLSVRKHGGRPLAGMRPAVRSHDGSLLARAVTVLLLPLDPGPATAHFRHLARRTHDPIERYDAALETLAASHYQRPGDFSDEMTALFALDSELAATLAAAPGCSLGFEQFQQSYRFPVSVAELVPEAPAWQATYWHNLLFNPSLPAAVRVLEFTPDWQQAEAEPLPPGA